MTKALEDGTFVPTSLQAAYLRERAIDEGQRGPKRRHRTDLEIAAELGCNPKTFCAWKRNPAFNRWLNDSLRADVFMSMGTLYVEARRLALNATDERVRMDAIKWLAERIEPDDKPIAAVSGTGGPMVVITIPGPPDERLPSTVVTIPALKEAV